MIESPLTVVSLFDGVGGFPLAFRRAGARTVATVEIDKNAAAVSAQEFPDATQFDDVTEVSGDDLRAAGFVCDRGVLTAGWPCQDNSVAGRRAGLDGARSGLWWEVVRLLDETRPRWFVGENVPGLLSVNDGRDFGAVLGSLAELGYGYAYRVLDAKYFGVPQQRRRVFIVGHLGAPWGAPAQVLLEPESCGGNSAPGSQTWPAVAGTLTAGTNSTGGTRPPGTQVDTANTLVVASALTARYAKGTDSDATDALVVSALTANGVGTCGPDDNQAQAGRIVVQPLAIRGRDGGSQLEIGPEGGPYNTLRAGDGGSSRQSLVAITGQYTHALTAEGADASEDGTGRGTPIVFDWQSDGGERGRPPISSSHASTLSTTRQDAVYHDTVVRRLTPLECERLQGYPDKWTEGQSDAQRYRQMGNSLAVPVVEWTAHRLVAVDSGLEDA